MPGIWGIPDMDLRASSGGEHGGPDLEPTSAARHSLPFGTREIGVCTSTDVALTKRPILSSSGPPENLRRLSMSSQDA